MNSTGEILNESNGIEDHIGWILSVISVIAIILTLLSCALGHVFYGKYCKKP